MGYTTADWVSAELKGNTFSAATAVKTAQVTEFITQADAMIDATISRRYSVPISAAASPISFSILRTVSTYLVAGRIERILKSTAANEDLKIYLKSLYKIGLEMLDKIKSGSITFPDADGSSAQISSYNVDNSVESQFSVDRDDW